MYVRVRKNGRTNRRSVIICHNISKNGRCYPVILKTLGHSSDEQQLQAWHQKAKDLIESDERHKLIKTFKIQAKKQMKHPPSLFDLREEKRINVGLEDIVGKLYTEIGFNQLLSKQHQSTLKKVIFARILEPGSKRKLSEISFEQLDEALPLNRTYRMMDALIESSELVETQIFEATKKAVGGKISLMLFDVTTLSFETVEEDELRAFGFSKDCKFKETQVVLALATTSEGLPIGYKLFPGDTAESTTLIASISSWRNHIKIDEVTVVGDRAMMSDANLSALESAGFNYIVAFPLKKLSREKKEAVLKEEDFINCEDSDGINSYKVLDYKKDRKLCVTYCEKRAAKDKKDRERLVKKAESKLQKGKNLKSLIKKNGYLKYAEINGHSTAFIDRDKITEDARWDGLHAVITNHQSCDKSIYEGYRKLWVIEESFRINKFNLKMRPIYHFTPNRIQTHILLCYMVYALIRHVQFRLKQKGCTLSAERIVNAIKNVQASILLDINHNKKYRMLSRLNEDAEAIYRIFNIQQGLAIAPYGGEL